MAAPAGLPHIPLVAASTSSGDRAIFEPLPPARILDTRAPSNPLGAGESRVLQVTGAGGVPTDATAVSLNVTATAPTTAGWLTLYPADASLPVASNVNFSAGQTVPNSATIRLGASGADLGRIKIFNSAGQTHVIVDVAGYFRGHTHDDRYYAKAQTQARLAANSLTCPAGSFLGAVAANGTPTCGVGATGPQGIPGPQGPAGPPGPSGSPPPAYVRARTAAQISISTAFPTFTKVQDINVPAGTYNVVARTNIMGFAAVEGSTVYSLGVYCQLGGGADFTHVTGSTAGDFGRLDELRVPITLNAIIVRSGPGSITVECAKTDSHPTVIATADAIIATPVGAVIPS